MSHAEDTRIARISAKGRDVPTPDVLKNLPLRPPTRGGHDA